MLKDIINFNKEILFGEIGAIVGIQTSSIILSRLDLSASFISYAVVLSAIIGASLFWFAMRMYDKTRHQKYLSKNVIEDISYYAPAAFVLTSLFYYPTLFFTTKYFLEHNRLVEFSATIAQVIAFTLFLIGINVYRFILMKYYKKEL